MKPTNQESAQSIDEEAADDRLFRLCELEIISRITRLKEGHSETAAKRAAPWSAPSFYETEPINGQSSRKRGIAASDRMKQWERDNTLHNRLKAIYKDQLAKIEPIYSLIAKSNTSALIEWANFLLPDENLKAVLDAIGDGTRAP